MENPYELLYMSRMNDPYALSRLLKQYEPIIRFLQREISDMNFDVNVGPDELLQEGRISFFDAVNNYRTDRETSFSTYSTVVVRRSMISRVRHYGRKKYGRLSSLLCLDDVNEYNTPYLEGIADGDGLKNPEYHAAYHSAREKLQRYLQKMTERERHLMMVWQSECSYAEGAERLGVTLKSYDASLQRLRRKLRRIIADDD
jgi:RNA polymerase sporulation-specific sigma factor